MNRKILTIIGVMSLTGLGVFAQNNHAFAYVTDSITSWPTYEDYVAPDEPVIAIDMNRSIVGDDNLDQIEGLPSSTSFYKPIGISVSNVKSYYISTYLDCSSLTDEEETKCEAGNLLTGSGDTLPSVSSAKTFGTMSNEWGFRYNIGNSVQDPKDKHFIPLSTTKAGGYLQLDGEERIKTNSSTNSDSKTLTLGFGAKVNGDTAAGTYNGKVTVAVVASPLDATTMGDITYFQQMTPEICKGTPKGREYALQDTRDLKIYKVAKLADNECWMIQNLALDSGETEETRRQINSKSSDLANGTTYLLPISSKTGFTDNDAQNMYNGTHVDNKYDNYLLGEGQTLRGYGDGTGDNTGAWYTWRTAVADSPEVSQDSGEASYSICPKGWELPNNKEATSQYQKLVRAYTSDGITEAFRIGYGGNNAGVTYVSSAVDYWSRSIFSDINAGSPYSLGGGLVSNAANPRKSGFGIRCIAK